MIEEVWLPVVGYEGVYEVSSEGRVKRIAGSVTRTIKGTTFTQSVKETILASNNGLTYPTVGLSLAGKVATRYIHELVAEAHIGPRPAGMQICHGKEGQRCAAVRNIRYDTPKGNAADRVRDGTDAIGENNPSAKLTESWVKDIKKRLPFDSLTQIARDYNVSPTTILDIKNGVRWKYV